MFKVISKYYSFTNLTFDIVGRVLDYQYASFPISITTLKNVIKDVESDGMPSVYMNFSFEVSRLNFVLFRVFIKCPFQDDGTKNPPKVSTVSIDARRVVRLSDQDTFNLQLRSVCQHINNVKCFT